jgi:DNA-binding response OmpR family regulator
MLCISNDETLLRTRRLLFEHDGYEVTSTLGFVAASESVSAGTFDVMFIGHSVPLRDMQDLIHQFRERSDAPIVAVRTPDENWGESSPGVRVLEIGHGPQAVLDTLREVCKNR